MILSQKVNQLESISVILLLKARKIMSVQFNLFHSFWLLRSELSNVGEYTFNINLIIALIVLNDCYWLLANFTYCRN